MKRGLLIMALFLAMVLFLILFPRNNAEANNGGYGAYGFPGSYGAYGFSGGYGAYGFPGSYSMYGGSLGGYGAYGFPGSYGTYGNLYGGYGMYGGLYGGYAWNPIGTAGGEIYVPARVEEPGTSILGPGSGVLPPVSNPTQSIPLPGPLNIYPPFMPSLGIGPIPYSVYPVSPEWSWSGFPTMASSQPPMFPWTPAFPSNSYWPEIYPPNPYPTFPGSIQIPR